MILVDRLLSNNTYLSHVQTIEENESSRIYCRHGLSHLLDVARIAWILCLENDLSFDKETVYLAALLHDIGRAISNANHDNEGERLARYLLNEIDAPSTTIHTICTAIGEHRKKAAIFNPHTASLGELLAWSDKRSRPCFHCSASASCKWSADKKNHTIRF